MTVSSLSVLLLAFFVVTASHAFSLNDLKNHNKQGKGLSLGDSQNQKIFTQKEVTRMTTRREPIRMPNQTPMVPWKVSQGGGINNQKIFHCLHSNLVL